MAQTITITKQLQTEESNLCAKGCWLRMNAVCATNHCGAAVRCCHLCDHANKFCERCIDGDACITQCPTQSRINYISTGESVMNPRTGRCADGCLNNINKRCNVVISDYFTFFYLSNKLLSNCWSIYATRLRCICWYDASICHRFCNAQLNLQPARHLSDFGKECVHFWCGVALNH